MQPNIPYQPLNTSRIINALTLINSQRSNQADIKTASNYLDECERHPHFSILLLSIYSEAPNIQLQLSSLILFINVIKRNWNFKHSTSIISSIQPKDKEQLRKGILPAYFLHQMNYYKHFNALIGFLARLEYPKQYIELHQFIISSLNQLIQMIKINVETVLKSNKVLSVLSTCKTILKEYSIKKISHNQDNFLQFITQIIRISRDLSEELTNKLKSHLQSNDTESVISLLECLRKIDKVVLYGISSIPSLFQYKPEVKGIVASFVKKIEDFNELYHLLRDQAHEMVIQQLEKYLIGILEQLSKLQGYYNFLFSDFLKEYLYIILKMLVQNVPDPQYYRSQKLLAIIISINGKAIETFVYSVTSEQYKKSIYHKKNSPVNSLEIQRQCHEKYRQIYSIDSVTQLLNTIITQIMTAPHILKDYKQFNDEWVLEDTEITSLQVPTQTSNYVNCIDLVKKILKRFREESLPLITTMIEKVEMLKTCSDSHSHQILINILEVVVTLPTIYQNEQLPINHICNVISSVYEIKLLGFLVKIIRKYYTSLPLLTLKTCFSILAHIVATPIDHIITPQIIFQSALALKILLGEMEYENVSIEVLTACVSKIASLVSMKEFINCPTLMWPIISILIKFAKMIFDTNKDAIEEIAKIIVQRLSHLICSENNEELVVCALAELISSLVFCCYNPIKFQYNIRGKPFVPSQKMQIISKSSFIVFEAAFALLKNNIRNKYLENNNIMFRFWLSILRTYPTIYTQQLYNLHLEETNQKLTGFFKNMSKDLFDKNPILFVQLLQEYFITQLIDLNENELSDPIQTCIRGYENIEENVQILIGLASLYYSYSLLKSPSLDILQTFLKYFVRFHRKIDPAINSYRTFVFLILGEHLLKSPSAEVYAFITNYFKGNVGSWFVPYLWSMHFVSNKFAVKLNKTVLLKAISDIGVANFSKLLMAKMEREVAIDHFIAVITLQTHLQKTEATYHAFSNIHRLLTHQLSSQLDHTFYRKVKLQISEELMKFITEVDLSIDLKNRLREILGCLNWSYQDIKAHLGEGTNNFCQFLGIKQKEQNNTRSL